jgi:hypothetical protein
MIRAMSEQDEAPASFFFPGAAQVEPLPSPGADETGSATPVPAEPAAWTAHAEPEPATTTLPPEPAARTAPAEPATTTAAPEPAAWTAAAEPEPATAEPPPASPDAAAISGAEPAGSAGDTAESFPVVNPDGSTTTRLPDGSFQTVVRLPGGATIVTSTQPPGASPAPAPADEPRGRRWRKRDR